MDVFITVDSSDHPYYRRPLRAHHALSYEISDGFDLVRSVVVLDSNTGLTSSYRHDEYADGPGVE